MKSKKICFPTLALPKQVQGSEQFQFFLSALLRLPHQIKLYDQLVFTKKRLERKTVIVKDGIY